MKTDRHVFFGHPLKKKSHVRLYFCLNVPLAPYISREAKPSLLSEFQKPTKKGFVNLIFIHMHVKDHWQLTDEEYEETFADYKLKPRLFSHEAHLRLAYIHISKYGAKRAEENMCTQIEGFALSLGAREKFNKTVTIGSVKTMHHYMQKSSSGSFKELVNEFPRLLTNFKDILGQHYGFNVFSDKRAKREYIPPDLLPFS